MREEGAFAARAVWFCIRDAVGVVRAVWLFWGLPAGIWVVLTLRWHPRYVSVLHAVPPVRLPLRWHPRFVSSLQASPLCVCRCAGIRALLARFTRRPCAFAVALASALC